MTPWSDGYPVVAIKRTITLPSASFLMAWTGLYPVLDCLAPLTPPWRWRQQGPPTCLVSYYTTIRRHNPKTTIWSILAIAFWVLTLCNDIILAVALKWEYFTRPLRTDPDGTLPPLIHSVLSNLLYKTWTDRSVSVHTHLYIKQYLKLKKYQKINQYVHMYIQLTQTNSVTCY
jgi:hypothetical protein